MTSEAQPRAGAAAGGAIRWTAAQADGIRTIGASLLVSAAAGSGKTAMLSERCAYLVCDAPLPQRCEIDELLVVTFTEKAAAEMKSRIASALRGRVERAPTDAIRRQLALVEQAQVSTLHSFCSRLLRQHFSLVDLDPGFVVMNGDEARLLRLEVGRALFDRRYEADEAGWFRRLIDQYASGDDEQLLSQALRVHEMLQSLLDPGQWLASARRRLVEAVEEDDDSDGADARHWADRSELAGEMRDLIAARLAALSERCEGAAGVLRRLGGPDPYLRDLEGIAAMIESWRRLLADSGIDALAEAVRNTSLPRMPTVRSTVPNQPAAKKILERVRDEIKKGPWRGSLRFNEAEWTDGMSRTLPMAMAFLDLVEAFGADYRAAKHADRRVDFSDLERLALEVLRDPSAPPGALEPSLTARAYHRLFKQVLVDEYQDINELQDAILSLLSHECLFPSASACGPAPNLFCVGDVKQSIYRFRLAEPRRFLDREQRYRAMSADAGWGRVIDLRENFRSRAPLLGAINGLFRRMMTRASAEIEYDATHELAPGLTFTDFGADPYFAGAPIELHLVPTRPSGASKEESPADDDTGNGAESGAMESADAAESERVERESAVIARRIREIVGLGGGPAMFVSDSAAPGGRRAARFRDIVILLRAMKHKSDDFAAGLARRGVPTHNGGGAGFFQTVEVRDVLALLALLDNQRQDLPLAAVLRGPLISALPTLGGVTREEAMARIRLRYAGEEPAPAFHESADRYAREETDALAKDLAGFFDRLRLWRRRAQRRPPADALWAVYQQTGLLAYVSALDNGAQRVANLLRLHELAGDFGGFARQGIGRFLEYLQSLQDDANFAAPSIASEADDVVRVMSIHNSKGLEFPIVIVPDLGKAINSKDSTGALLVDRQAGLGMRVVDEPLNVRYPSLAWTLAADRLRRQTMAEELRVLYVAMTRAREHLVLVGSCAEKSAETWSGRWANHAGALPADAIVGAHCPLDWLGAASACGPGDEGEIVRVIQHAFNDGADIAPAPRPREGGRLGLAAARQPIDPAPPSGPAVAAVVQRLAYVYPYKELTGRVGAQSVTTRAKKAVASPPSPALPAADAPTRVATPLDLPRFFDAGQAPTGADVGTATHLVLEHLDLSRDIGPAELASRIDELIGKRILEPRLADRVDREAILWYLATDLARLVRDNADCLMRELPIYYADSADAPTQPSPADAVMVRGRLDLFLNLPGGGIIIDYKTDAVTAETAPARADFYRGQVLLYARAMRQITGRPVTQGMLVFLRPRLIIPVLAPPGP